MSLMKKNQARHAAKPAVVVIESTQTRRKKNSGSETANPPGKLGWQSRHALMVSALANALAELSSHNSVEVRAQIKRDRLIPDFAEYLQDYRAAGQSFPNEPLIYFVIWQFDIGDVEQALEWGFFALEQGQSMPERFKRDLATYIADETIGWAEQQFKAGNSIEPYFGQVLAKVEDEWKLFEKITANYFKLAGLSLLTGEPTEEQQKAALEYFRKAHEKYSKVGVKTRMNELEKVLGI
ncbi:phage terminase small subunit [uncultured Amphritea sp.]|uniref:phage terminase small subunit n=1 Tax=uncultured Amphritea sp. TaxID=981605 RepID=UPI0025F82AE8|nr:phage terminase small subunit [uncultured Amphritea sp.]